MKTFKQIKNISDSYSKMMRDLFPSSFDDEKLNNLLINIVFDDEKTIFINKLKNEWKENEFKTLVYSLIEEKKQKDDSNKTVKELLWEAWYDFYIIKNPEDTEQFRKYYEKNEIICSFNKNDRMLSNYKVFWIVKKDIDTIKRSDTPERQDKYWTSCCSIKVWKNDLYITNRYNHTVNSPDNTFNRNLDNIINWLSCAFEKEFNLVLYYSRENTFELKNFIFKNNKFIYFNYEINNIYYWINKIMKYWKLKFYDSQNYILIDYYLINLKEKKIEIIDKSIKDDFFNFKFNKIIIKKNNDFENDKDEVWTLIIYK